MAFNRPRHIPEVRLAEATREPENPPGRIRDPEYNYFAQAIREEQALRGRRRGFAENYLMTDDNPWARAADRYRQEMAREEALNIRTDFNTHTHDMQHRFTQEPTRPNPVRGQEHEGDMIVNGNLIVSGSITCLSIDCESLQCETANTPEDYDDIVLENKELETENMRLRLLLKKLGVTA